MYCPTCHQRISDRAAVCPYCGAPQQPQRRGRLGLFALILACVTLTLLVEGGTQMLREDQGPSAEHSGNPERGSAVQVKEGPLGSAGYLRGDVLLVSMYVNDRKTAWDEDREANARSCVEVACNFLEREAAAYGEELKFCYDVEEHPDLLYYAQFSGDAVKDINGQFTRWLYKWIDQNIPVADLQKEYGTENVAFLAMVADEGGSYTNVYYVEDPERYFNESSVVFYYYDYGRLTDREVPAVYAHELLHQFGAIDLYEGSPDFSPENIAYVAETYPDDIMYSEYTEAGRLNYETINLSIGPVTAYYLGWLDELPREDQEGLTDYERVCVAGFSYDDPTFSDEDDE